MIAQPGIAQPQSFPIRSPKDPNMKNGRMANAPRYNKGLGGSNGPGMWASESDFPVERPTAVKAGSKASEKKIG